MDGMLSGMWEEAGLIVAFFLQPIFILVVPALVGWYAARPTFLRGALPKGAAELGLACRPATRFIGLAHEDPWLAIRQLVLLPNPTSASIILEGTHAEVTFLYTQFRTKLPLTRFSVFFLPVSDAARFPAFACIRTHWSARYDSGSGMKRAVGRSFQSLLSEIPGELHGPLRHVTPDTETILLDLASRFGGVRVESSHLPGGIPAIAIVLDEHVFGERPISAASSTEWKHFQWTLARVAEGVRTFAPSAGRTGDSTAKITRNPEVPTGAPSTGFPEQDMPAVPQKEGITPLAVPHKPV